VPVRGKGWCYKGIQKLLGRETEQTHFGFVESHPLIRSLGTYSDFINQTQTDHPTNDASNQHP
jgi:hypothetical protein